MSENESLMERKNATKDKQSSEDSAGGADELDLDFAAIKESRDKQNKQQSIVHPGLYLRKAREDRDIDRTEIALKMKLNTELIEALEDGNEDILPGSVFTSGYIRSYARLVNLSPSAMVEEYQRYIRQQKTNKVVKIERPKMPPLPGIVDNLKEYLSSTSFISDTSPEAKSARYAAAGVAVVILLVAFLVIFGTSDDAPDLPKVAISDLGPLDKTITTPITQEKISLDTVGGDGVAAEQPGERRKAPPINVNTEAKKPSLSPIGVEVSVKEAATPDVEKSSNSQESASAALSQIPQVEPKNVGAQATQAVDIKRSTSSGTDYLIKPLDTGQAATGTRRAGSVPGNGALLTYVTLTVRYTAESWVDVRDATGKRLIGNVGKANTEKEVTGPPPFKILIGFSPGVTIEYNGVPIDYSSQQVRSVARFTLAATPTVE